MAKLNVNFAGVRLKNPVIVSSSETTRSYEGMKKAIEAGASAIVAKSICNSAELARADKHPKYAVLNERHEPCQGEIPRCFTFYCRAGIPLEADQWMETLLRIQHFANKHDSVLIGSIAAGDLEWMIDTAKNMEDLGIKMVEIDAGCPHPDELNVDYEKAIVRSKKLGVKIAKAICENVSIPIIYKLTPQMPDILGTAKAIKEAGVEAVTLTNRFLGFLVDVEEGRPYLHSRAGVGGPWVLPLSLRWVNKVYEQMPDLAISGSNGGYNWRDVIQFMMSGATTVQFCSVIMLKGYNIISEIIDNVNSFLDKEGYKDISKIIGIATKKTKSYKELYSLKEEAVINEGLCTKCGNCLRSCFYDGVVLEDGIPKVTENCIGCGLCTQVCPAEAIYLTKAE